ncbi:MAG TPA: serine hydrolase domain-containing protein [Gemmatimonadaceae bacterium]|nr:serine hydrolase domain-containing protein [Gemmatimonadaceae bacterium]
MKTRLAAVALVLVAGAVAPIRSVAAQAAVPAAALRAEPARFTDPDRVAKLSATFGDIDRVFREFAERQHIPGAVWGIVIDGRLAHVGVSGYRDVAARLPVDSGTVFRIASMTKSFTAMAILKLRDEGKLSLDDPAERWVPELAGLPYPTTDSPKITIRHLLSHAEGFPEDNPWGDQQLAVSDEEMSRMMRAGIPFSNAPGVAYEYSNYGFAILGRIVTNASGVPYRRYIAEHVLRPLGMTSTTLEPASVPKARLAQGYRWEDEQWKLEPQLPDGAFGAMGGMLTSMQDLGVYVGALLGAWPPRDGPETGPVSRATLREMQQIHRPRPAFVARGANSALLLSSGGYGYGLGISGDCNFAHIVAHSGGLPGFGSIMRWLPEYGVGIIAFGNRTYTGWGPPTTEALNIMLRTGALVPRTPMPAPVLVQRRDEVTRLVLDWNDRLADSMAAVNLFLDRSADRRKAEIATFKSQVGPCRAGTGFDVVENALRGQWTLPCERGALRVSITLAPTTPPLVQYLEVARAQSASPPPPRALCPQ